MMAVLFIGIVDEDLVNAKTRSENLFEFGFLFNPITAGIHGLS